MATADSTNALSGLPFFNGNDYSVWKYRLEVFLREKNLTANITVPPTEENLNSDEWKNRDAKAMNFIVRCVADTHMDYIREKETAYEMIATLNEMFERKTIGTKIYLTHFEHLYDFSYSKFKKLYKINRKRKMFTINCILLYDTLAISCNIKVLKFI